MKLINRVKRMHSAFMLQVSAPVLGAFLSALGVLGGEDL
jgi:hypothetical protein